MTEHPAAEHPSPVTPQTEAGRALMRRQHWNPMMPAQIDDWTDPEWFLNSILAIEREAADAARKEVLDEIRKMWNADPGWPRLHVILDSLARPVEEERHDQ